MSSEQIIAELYFEMKKVRAELAEVKAIIIGQPSHVEGWADHHKAAAALQAEGVKNAAELNRLRRAGVFKEGSEFRVKPNAKRTDTKSPRYQYHIPKCRKALQRWFK